MSTISPYGPTAARKHGRPGCEARPRGTTIDVHSHVAVPTAATIVAPHLESERLRDLDDMGVDVQAVMPPPMQRYYTVPSISPSRPLASSTKASLSMSPGSPIASSGSAAYR